MLSSQCVDYVSNKSQILSTQHSLNISNLESFKKKKFSQAHDNTSHPNYSSTRIPNNFRRTSQPPLSPAETRRYPLSTSTIQHPSASLPHTDILLFLASAAPHQPPRPSFFSLAAEHVTSRSLAQLQDHRVKDNSGRASSPIKASRRGKIGMSRGRVFAFFRAAAAAVRGRALRAR